MSFLRVKYIAIFIIVILSLAACSQEIAYEPPPAERPVQSEVKETENAEAQSPGLNDGAQKDGETQNPAANGEETQEPEVNSGETQNTDNGITGEGAEEKPSGVTDMPEPPGADGGQINEQTDEPQVIGDEKIAYITIDDGPSKNITPQILDLLAAEGIKATFFVLPHNGVDEIYQRIIDEGHELGNHSYSHVYSKLYEEDNLDAFKEDVLEARNFIYDKFGYTTVSYRFPGGAMGRKAEIIEPRKEILAELGYRHFDWDLTTGDADKSGSGKDAEILTGNVLNNIRGRKKIIILMHDTSDKKATLEALPAIIAGLRERGYSFDIMKNY